MINGLKSKITGITLVELMIAMVISAILLVGVGTIYGNSKRTYNIDAEFAQLQENARIAMKYIVEDMRMAGYIGCAWNNGDPSTFICDLNDSFVCNATTAGIDGYDASDTGAMVVTPKEMVDTKDNSTGSAGSDGKLDIGTTSDWANNNGGSATNLTSLFGTTGQEPVAGSDVVILRHGAGGGVKQTTTNDAGNLWIEDQGGVGVVGNCHVPAGICIDDILIISDCSKARVFQVTNMTQTGGSPSEINIVHAASGTPGNLPPASWSGASAKEYTFDKEDSEILKFRSYIYYVGNSTRNNEPVLYRNSGITGVDSEELVEGIENLQILYGIDDDNNGVADRYTSANNVNFADLARPIVSIRISMLVRSKENVAGGGDKQETYDLATTPITTLNDRRLRKVFTTTVKIRNKGI